LRDGLVTVDIVPGENKLLRKVYSVTESGRRALQEWTNQSVKTGASLKAFLMRLMLASNLSHTELIAYLQQRRSQVAVHRAALERVTEAQDEMGQRLAFDYGLVAATAELDWLDHTLESLSQ